MEGQNAMPNFVQIGRTVERYGCFSIFQYGGRPPSWIYQKWPTQREPNLAPSRNWYLMVISNSGPKMVLVEQFEQSRCFRRLIPITNKNPAIFYRIFGGAIVLHLDNVPLASGNIRCQSTANSPIVRLLNDATGNADILVLGKSRTMYNQTVLRKVVVCIISCSYHTARLTHNVICK